MTNAILDQMDMTAYRSPTKKDFKKALKEVGPTEAGSGDSPYTQEWMDGAWGKNKRKSSEEMKND